MKKVPEIFFFMGTNYFQDGTKNEVFCVRMPPDRIEVSEMQKASPLPCSGLETQELSEDAYLSYWLLSTQSEMQEAV
jgi:hypothetical protein